MKDYTQFLIEQIFESNGYESSDELIENINEASAVRDVRWQYKKGLFNEIAEIAPMRDHELGYVLRYEDVPPFIEQQVADWERFNNEE